MQGGAKPDLPCDIRAAHLSTRWQLLFIIFFHYITAEAKKQPLLDFYFGFNYRFQILFQTY
jgi:hypothetical protein